jgi:alpha-beta hydrolase superfamily lysophospholipase
MTRLPLCTVLMLVPLTACMRLDGFVWGAMPVTDLGMDMMANSQVPAQYRTEYFDSVTGIVSPDGTVVDAYLLTHSPTDGTPTQRNHIVLLYCHGQDNNISTSVPRTDALWYQGYSVLAIDWRGFGKTKGTPTDSGVYMDTEASYDWLVKQNQFKIGIYGRSLGTAICLKAAVDRKATALVLESPISSIQDIINQSLSLTTPSDYYVDSRLNNDTEIPGYTGDLLIMHGSADTYVPPTDGEELNKLARGHAAIDTFWLVPGADHDTVPCTNKQDPTQENSCIGGLAGFSSDYYSYVNGLYDPAFGD